MRALLLTALLSAHPPTPAQARKLAAQHAWEDLYLSWSSVDPRRYPSPERRTIAAALLKGCDALAGSDAVMAYSLGERAVLFHETVPGLRCLARTALATDQRGTAEEALRRGLKHFPREGHFGLELGRLLLEDRNPQGALEVLNKVPPRSPEAPKARLLMQQARALEQDKGSVQMASATSSPSSASDGGEDGMRTRANSRFVVRYFNNARDFGQRAEYEGRIISVLEEAHAHTRQVLGETREAPVDVVLYTREEFRTHQGAALARAVAGLYSDGAIRINDAAELTPQTRATLVHEYVHAVVDELVKSTRGGRSVPVWLDEGLAEYVEWRYLGNDEPPYELANRLRGAARSGQLPLLSEMAGRALVEQKDPALAYGTSAVAVGELLKEGGPARLLQLIREVGQGASFEAALQRRYGRSIPELDAMVKVALSRR